MSNSAEDVANKIVDLIFSMSLNCGGYDNEGKKKLAEVLEKFVDERATEIADERIDLNRWRWEKDE